MKEVKLTQGYVAYVDDTDFERVSQYSWSLQTGSKSNKLYAKAMINNQSTLLHRFILGLTVYDLDVDHKNGNGLDCTRNNIRLCTNAQNQMNVGLKSNNTTGYKGVTYHKANRRYTAHITINGKRKHLGCYDDPMLAALKYDTEAFKLFGEFAHLNFPEVYSHVR